MKSVNYVLPDVALAKLKKIISTYYLAYLNGTTILDANELVDFSQRKTYPADRIYIRQATGANSFLCKLGILEQPEKSKYRLTELGLELGKSLKDNATSTASTSSWCWSQAIDHSPFLVELYKEVELFGEIEKKKLQDDIIVKAGRKPTSQSAQRGALLIINLWQEAQKINKQLVKDTHGIIIRVAKNSDVSTYISNDKLAALRALKNTKYDLKKLIRVCEEINFNYEKNNFFAVGILVRVILDHVPPIFGFTHFKEVASNYGGTASFSKNAEHLEKFSRDVSNLYLHTVISDKDQSANPL